MNSVDGTLEHEDGMQSTPLSRSTKREEGIARALWRQKWVVVLTAAACVTAGAVYLRAMPGGYTANARLYVQKTNPKVMGESQPTINQSNNYVYTQAEIIKSTPILSAAATPENVKALGPTQTSDPVLSLKNKLAISVGRTDDIITVSLSAPTQQGAAQVVNSVVDSYIASQTQQTKSTSSEILKVLTAEKTKQDELLTKRMAEVSEFRKANGILSLESGQGNLVLQRLAQFSESQAAAQLAAINAKAAYAAAKTVLDKPESKNVIKSGQALAGILLAQGHDLPQDDQAVQQAELKLASLKREFTDEHPAVQAAAETVARLKAEREAAKSGTAESYLAALEQQSIAAHDREVAIQSVYDTQLNQAMELNNKSAEYGWMQSELKRAEHLCEALDSRIKELSVTNEVGALNVTILESARAESSLPSPSPTRVLSLAGLIGLVAGIGLALVRAGLDSQIHSAETVRDTLDLPVLGSVPHCTWGRDNLGALVEGEPNSALAESFRKIRTALRYGSQGAGKVVVVTSPRVGEGKTMVAGNLAVALACSGLKVLLVDADLRSPCQHGRFGLQNEVGLSTALRGGCAVKDAIRSSTIVGLDVMPSGPADQSPAELLTGIGNALKSVAEQYDYVVIDTPPLGPVTDAAVVATASDRVVLVLRAGTSEREQSHDAVEALRQVGAHMAGVVFNGVRNAAGHYGYSRGSASRARKAARTSSQKVATQAATPGNKE